MRTRVVGIEVRVSLELDEPLVTQLEVRGPLVSVDSVGAVVGFTPDGRTWVRVGASGWQVKADGSVGRARRRAINWSAPDEVRQLLIDEAVRELGAAGRQARSIR
jgi:hypothetical protein